MNPMKKGITHVVSFLFFGSISFSQSEMMPATLPGQAQPEYYLSKAERLGWAEIVSERKEFSSVFQIDNKKIAYSSTVPVNYRNSEGELVPVDIRPHSSPTGWIAAQQPIPVKITNQGSFFVGNNEVEYSQTFSINGQSPIQTQGRQEGQFIFFDNITNGVSKQIITRHGSVKYNYILHHQPALMSSNWTAKEKIKLPEGFSILRNKNNETGEPQWFVFNSKEEQEGAIFPVVCYDAAGKAQTGNMELIVREGEEAIFEITVSQDWLSAPERIYPVIVDPLVTGPTTTWSGGVFPSCFFPNYYSDATINVFVPGGITVTNLSLTTNFYASPFTTTVMGDGRMYFSTSCGQTNVFQVQGTNGNLPGTAYLDNFNVQNPLMCCTPQSCSASNVEIRMHLSRTSNGAACNSTFLYYDAGSLWPFSAYIEGYTPEAYGSEMIFQPSTICANDCDVNARIYARYGVPPFTFTHPWAAAPVDTGNANGCSVGNTIAQMPLQIPNCPNFCDPSTVLQVPPPVVTDACGATVSFYDAFYTLNIKPAATLTPIQDTIIVCSDEPINIEWVSCLPGAEISWYGSGQTGIGFTHNEIISNETNVPQPFAYIASPELNGCSGPESEVYVIVFPFVTSVFSAEPTSAVINTPVIFTDQTLLNGNTATGWEWTFGDGQVSSEQNPQHVYAQPGTYQVCLAVVTELGCSEEICDSITVVPAELELPNIITPNGDNVNDFLAIKYLEFYPANRIKVYNRWGNIVFEKKDYINDWSPKNISDGVYFYVLTLDGGKEYSQILHINK